MCGSSTIGGSSATRSRAITGCSTARITATPPARIEACRDKLDEIRRRDKLAADGRQGRHHSARPVPHAVAPWTRSCTRIAEAGGYTVILHGLSHDARQRRLDHARSLDSVVRSLEGISEINFVAHSLGNLVVRHWLKTLPTPKRTLPAGQTFGRMVMLAPPNQQPQLATKLIRGALAKFVAGPAAEATGHRLGESGAEAGHAALRVRHPGRRQGRRPRLQPAHSRRR